MEPTQIIVLIILLALSFLGFRFFKRRFEKVPAWLRNNALFLSFGTFAAIAFTPFLYPYSIWKNLAVFSIIPFCAYNIFYLVNNIVNFRELNKVAQEIINVLSLILGAFIGMIVINILHIGIFNWDDMTVMLVTAFLFSLVRILFNYSKLDKLFTKDQVALKIIKASELRTQQKLDMLYNRINPHFLYNSLNSIAGLAMLDGKKTKDMTIALSRLLRYSLDYTDNHFATIDEETESVRNYMEIEQIRLGENLNYEIDLSKDVASCQIPRFLLQPLVENCIKHAFIGAEKGNFVRLTFAGSERDLSINIYDNGVPFPDKIIPGYGFKHVSDALQLFFPDKYNFQVTNTPQKEVKIVIKGLNKKDESPS